MMDDAVDAALNRPVPRPRRTVERKKSAAEEPPTSYENVTIFNDRSGPSVQVDSDKGAKNTLTDASYDKSNPYRDVMDEISRLAIETVLPDKGDAERPKPVPRQRQHRHPEPDNGRAGDGDAKREEGHHRTAPQRPQPPNVLSTSSNSTPENEAYKARSNVKAASPGDPAMNRSSSTNTLNSLDGSEGSAKYKTSSPSHILRSIGASSKLLTEAITERVNQKTKGARKKILRTSKNTLSTLSTDATSTFMMVRSKISSMSQDKQPNKMSDEVVDERPVTLAAGDNAFQASIVIF